MDVGTLPFPLSLFVPLIKYISRRVKVQGNRGSLYFPQLMESYEGKELLVYSAFDLRLPKKSEQNH